MITVLWLTSVIGGVDPRRFVFDNLENIILVIIMINIVAGIIIDTFGLLREEDERSKKDIHEKCFICGISKYNPASDHL